MKSASHARTALTCVPHCTRLQPIPHPDPQLIPHPDPQPIPHPDPQLIPHPDLPPIPHPARAEERPSLFNGVRRSVRSGAKHLDVCDGISLMTDCRHQSSSPRPTRVARNGCFRRTWRNLTTKNIPCSPGFCLLRFYFWHIWAQNVSHPVTASKSFFPRNSHV